MSLNTQKIKEAIHFSYHLMKPGPKTKNWTLTMANRFKTDLCIWESILWLDPQTETLSTPTRYPGLKLAHFILSTYLINCFSVLHTKWKWSGKKEKLTGFLCPLWLSIPPQCTIKAADLWFIKAYHLILCSGKNISKE